MYDLPLLALAQLDVAPPTSNLQAWELILAFLLPNLLSLIIQSGWSRRAQSLLAFGVSAVATTITLWVSGELSNWTDLTTTVLTVFALTIAFYQGFWKPTGIASKLEESTNVVK